MKDGRVPANIDAYIAGFPAEVQDRLRKIRATIRKAAPHAKEAISYRIPTFMENGPVIYFAAFRDHISVYPAPRGNPRFKTELARYKGGKGTAQFPLDRPIPYGLISRMTKFRLRENASRAKATKR